MLHAAWPVDPDHLLQLPPLERRLLRRPTALVARRLLGTLVVRDHPQGVVAVRLTEVEAYLGVRDPAAHTFGGRRTPRNEVMWGDAGHLYVYFVYGMHHCMNVVARAPGVPEAVLLRGGVVVAGAEVVSRRRPGWDGRPLDGPAKLCQALAVDRADNGTDLTTGSVRLCDDGQRWPEHLIRRGPRVGVAYAGEAAAWPLRFFLGPE